MFQRFASRSQAWLLFRGTTRPSQFIDCHTNGVPFACSLNELTVSVAVCVLQMTLRFSNAVQEGEWEAGEYWGACRGWLGTNEVRGVDWHPSSRARPTRSPCARKAPPATAGLADEGSPGLIARLGIAATTAAAIGLLWTAQAERLVGQGHVSAARSGAPGAGAGQLSAPSGVADRRGEWARVRLGHRQRTGRHLQARRLGPLTNTSRSSRSKTRGRSRSITPRAVGSHAGRGVHRRRGHPEEAEEAERDTLYVYSPPAGEVAQKIHTFKFKEKGGEEREEEFEEQISGRRRRCDRDALGLLGRRRPDRRLRAKGRTAGARPSSNGSPSLRRSMEERFECYARPAFAVAPDASAFYTGYERRGRRPANAQANTKRHQTQP